MGIGVTAPDEKLEVDGTIRVHGALGQFKALGDVEPYAEKKEYIQFVQTDGLNDGARLYAEGDSNKGKLVLSIGDDMDANEAFIIRGEKHEGSSQDIAVFRGDGNVGIGTSDPNAKLEVIANETDNAALFEGGNGVDIKGVTGNKNALYVYENTTSYPAVWLGNNGSGETLYVKQEGAGHAASFIGGKVGIGTTDPRAKLEVIGEGNRSITGYNYMNSNTMTVVTGAPVLSFRTILGIPAVTNVSASRDTSFPKLDVYGGTYSGYAIYTDNRIACSEINIHCDERIKTNTTQSNSKDDLETLLKIQVTNYDHKDPLTHGAAPQKKVLGQQVAAVYPQAVDTNNKEVVPDIMQFTASNANGEITLEDHKLKVGDNVRILYTQNEEDKEELFEVLDVTETGFKVAIPAYEKIFVYGKQVNDFHIVDLDAISMLNVSATQELYKTIKILQDKVEQLEAQVNK